MGQIVIVYYSETGNTEAMANMVAKGVEAAGATAKVVPVVSKITGDADVQTQKVSSDSSHKVILEYSFFREAISFRRACLAV